MWFHQEVAPRLRGRSRLVRYADDAAVLFEYEEDAQRVMPILPKRFGKYGRERLLCDGMRAKQNHATLPGEGVGG